ncbi:MAG: hypothetical protein EB830_03575 [Nitrosopumilus sp. H13]|nr:MAG: hypothetical protein EB830_03575 [Nitrosopumilus sp. H13]
MQENFAGNIIINLASLPDFLRTPILKKRMAEFFSMTEPERTEVVLNALEAGPTIPFPNFAKLFKTWLQVVAAMPQEQRDGLFSAYIAQVVKSPEKLVPYNLDGILGVFLELDANQQRMISESVSRIILALGSEQQRMMTLLIPDGARVRLGI